MTRRLWLHPEASQEITAAVGHAEHEFPGRGVRLREEVDHVLDRIVETPEQASPYLHRTRRFVLVRFPYSTVFVSREIGCVVAFAHHSRRPGYWRKRLRSIH
jgi:plasmid stabilization system protein ParE